MAHSFSAQVCKSLVIQCMKLAQSRLSFRKAMAQTGKQPAWGSSIEWISIKTHRKHYHSELNSFCWGHLPDQQSCCHELLGTSHSNLRPNHYHLRKDKFELQQESSGPMSDSFVGSDRVPIKRIAYTIPAHHPPSNGGCHSE